MFVDCLQFFLDLNDEQIADLQHLYLANSTLSSLFALEDDFLAFLEKLKRATSLKKLNLRNNNLAHIQLLRIASALKSIVHLEYVNLLQNSPLKPSDVAKFPKADKFLAENIPTTLPVLELPVGWSLAHRFYIVEIAEILVIARLKYEFNPRLIKLHAYDKPITHKHNQELNYPQHIQTNLPLPIIMLSAQTSVIVPHYSTEQMPNKISELLQAQRRSGFVTDRYKLVLVCNGHHISWAWAKICLTSDLHKNAKVRLARLKTNQSDINITRPYQKKPDAMKLETMPLYKLYSIGKYFGSDDVWDAAINCEGIVPADKIRMGINMLLETIYWHAAGLLHTDIKPENFVVRNMHETKLVDLGNVVLIRDPQKLSSTASHTFRHIPPEARSLEVNTYTSAFDYYSMGYSLLRLFVRELDSEQRPTLDESILAIRQAYSDEIANVVVGLLHKDPKQRLSIQAALLRFFALFPGIVEQSINAHCSRTKDDISNFCALYPQAKELLITVRPDILEAHIHSQINNEQQLTVVLNILFKLQTLLFYLTTFKVSATPDQALLVTAIQQLFAQPTKSLLECIEQYFYFPALEHSIIALHNARQTEEASFASMQRTCTMG